MFSLSLHEIADLVDGTASQSPGLTLTGVKPLEYANASDITYILGPQFVPKLDKSNAGAVIIPIDLEYDGLPYVRCKSPEVAFAKLTQRFYPLKKSCGTISPNAAIHKDAVLDENVSVGSFSVVEAGVSIGANTIIGHNVVVGECTRIGKNVRIYSNVTIYPNVTIGNEVVIHSGSIIGADGFGYAHEMGPQGPVLHKKHHCGTVEIEDGAEIGALVSIDRALAGVTKIGRNVKIDNLVQIAHNVHIGEGTVIASQAGIAGSSSLGKYCLLGGQVGVRDHVEVGDGVILATRVGIYRNVPSGSVMAGSVPAMPHKIFLRVQTLFKRLPELLDRIRKLENKINKESKDNT